MMTDRKRELCRRSINFCCEQLASEEEIAIRFIEILQAFEGRLARRRCLCPGELCPDWAENQRASLR